MNRVVHVKAFDPANPTSGLEVAEVAIPEPGANEVLIRLNLRPVNPADIFSIMGVYPGFTPKTLPAVPGLEGVGLVEEVGANVTGFSKGQRVVGTPFTSVKGGNGTWQQYLVAPADDIMLVPDAVSDDVAAQYFVNPVTVVGMVQSLNVPKGEWLLQTAAGSVLGRQMVQVCKHEGVRTINVVRRAAQVAELKALGADEVVVSSEEESISKKVMEITNGKGAYGAVDCVGGDLFAEVCSSVRLNGTVLMYGAMSGMTATISIPDPLFRGVTIRGFWVSTYLHSLPREERKRVLERTMEYLATKVLAPYSGNKYALDDVISAIAEATKEARGGKVFLEG